MVPELISKYLSPASHLVYVARIRSNDGNSFSTTELHQKFRTGTTGYAKACDFTSIESGHAPCFQLQAAHSSKLCSMIRFLKSITPVTNQEQTDSKQQKSSQDERSIAFGIWSPCSISFALPT